MNELILAVDDEPLVLNAYQRNLGDRFRILTAEGADLALSAMRNESFAVILSDLKMPGMDGITFLDTARTLQPDAARMLISGHADMSDAVNSVNRAGIFRLLLKPCPTEDLATALEAGIEQHRLVTVERTLLENTLGGAVQALTDILAILDIEAFGQAQLKQRIARKVAESLGAPVWEFEMAAQLAEIGRATFPPALNAKIAVHAKLTEAEAKLVERIPTFSHMLLQHIPRIENVAKAVLYQAKNMDGSGYPNDEISGADIPLAARALRAINAFVTMWQQNTKPADAVAFLRAAHKKFDPKIVELLLPCERILLSQASTKAAQIGRQHVMIRDLIPNMQLLEDLETQQGMVVLASGTRLTPVSIQRIHNFAALNPIREPIIVELLE